MAITIFQYPKCSTCKKALQFLDENSINYVSIPINTVSPTKKDLEAMLKYYHGDLKRLFNTSGLEYRKLHLKDSLTEMSKTEALKLLSSNGMLVKRPFVLADDFGLVGFNQKEWEEKLLK